MMEHTPGYRQPRHSWRFPVALLSTFALLVIAVILLGQIRAAIDPDYRAAQRYEQLRQQQIDSQLAPIDTIVAAGWRLLPLLLVASAGAVALLVVYRRFADHRYIEAYHITRLVQAQHPALPKHLQTYTHHEAARTLPAAPQAPLIAQPEASAAEILPDSVSLAGVLETVPKGHLAYGMLSSGQPLTLPLSAGYHILAHGDVRSGKTNFLDSLLVQLHHKAAHYDIRLIAGDFKRELAATWTRSPLLESVETDPAAIAEMLEQIVSGKDGVLARYQSYQQLGEQQGRIIRNIGDWCKVTGERPRLVFLCVDELNAVLEAADKKDNLAGALKIALQTGAGAGVFVMGGAQYLSSKTFGRDGSKQFVTRAHFGAWDPTAIRVMFGDRIAEETRELLTAQPGRGLIRTVGQAAPQPFQALRCGEDDILGAIKRIADDQPTMPKLTPNLATQQQPRKASATATTNCYDRPDLAEIVLRLRAANTSKTKTIELVWGVKAGSNEKYKVASATYDRITSEVIE